MANHFWRRWRLLTNITGHSNEYISHLYSTHLKITLNIKIYVAKLSCSACNLVLKTFKRRDNYNSGYFHRAFAILQLVKDSFCEIIYLIWRDGLIRSLSFTWFTALLVLFYHRSMQPIITGRQISKGNVWTYWSNKPMPPN